MDEKEAVEIPVEKMDQITISKTIFKVVARL